MGLMKAVVLDRSPAAKCVDLSHSVPRFSETAAAFLLEYSVPFIPHGAVVAVVVDPGVGGEREIIAVEDKQNRKFIAPDTGIVEGLDWQKAYRVKNENIFIETECRTFDGRDKFAPAAGFLSQGGEMSQLGTVLTRSPRGSLIPEPEVSAQKIHGEVVYRDHFGNCITNLRPGLLPPDKKPVFEFRDRSIEGLSENYEGDQQLIALVGSFRRVEFAVPRGSAWDNFDISIGDTFQVELE